MPAYTVRVQLTGEPDQNIYDDLHSRMEKGGFLRTVTGKKTRDLPHGTYYGSSIKTVTEVRDWTKQQAKAAWGKSTIFVAQTETWSWGKS
jgi:hypothetical protein